MQPSDDERAHLDYQNYMLSTGQWDYPGTPIGSPAPAEPPLSENPIRDRLRDIDAAGRATANGFDFEGWCQSYYLRSATRCFKIGRVPGDYSPVVIDFLRHADIGRLEQVWILPGPPDFSMLLQGDPRHLVDTGALLGLHGAARRAVRRLVKAGLADFKHDAVNDRAYPVTMKDPSWDTEGYFARQVDDGDPVWIFPDGLRWADGYPYSSISTPQRFADRCVKWLQNG